MISKYSLFQSFKQKMQSHRSWLKKHYLASNRSVSHIQSPKGDWMEKTPAQQSQNQNIPCPPSLPKSACATETALCCTQTHAHTLKSPSKLSPSLCPDTHIHQSVPRCIWGAAPVLSPAKPDPGTSSWGRRREAQASHRGEPRGIPAYSHSWAENTQSWLDRTVYPKPKPHLKLRVGHLIDLNSEGIWEMRLKL